MMGRAHCNSEELEAHRILDLARLGGDVSGGMVSWCLWVLGDLVGLRDFDE